MIIEIYTRKSPPCTYCEAAKMLLDNKGQDYVEYVVGVDITRERLIEAFPESKTFPVVCVDNKPIGGFEQLKTFLDMKGMSL